MLGYLGRWETKLMSSPWPWVVGEGIVWLHHPQFPRHGLAPSIPVALFPCLQLLLAVQTGYLLVSLLRFPLQTKWDPRLCLFSYL